MNRIKSIALLCIKEIKTLQKTLIEQKLCSIIPLIVGYCAVTAPHWILYSVHTELRVLPCVIFDYNERASAARVHRVFWSFSTPDLLYWSTRWPEWSVKYRTSLFFVCLSFCQSFTPQSCMNQVISHRSLFSLWHAYSLWRPENQIWFLVLSENSKGWSE